MCSDLAVDLRMRMGDWFRVVQLLKTGGGAGEYYGLWRKLNYANFTFEVWILAARLLIVVNFLPSLRWWQFAEWCMECNWRLLLWEAKVLQCHYILQPGAELQPPLGMLLYLGGLCWTTKTRRCPARLPPTATGTSLHQWLCTFYKWLHIYVRT